VALSRRDFIRNGSLFLLAPGIDKFAMPSLKDSILFGIITDVHYADCDARGSRHYRDSKLKMREAVDALAKRKPSFCVCLGDLIDGPAKSNPEVETQNLATIKAEFDRLHVPHKFVLGNHCVAQLTKMQFLDGVKQPKSYFSFDHDDFHFVVLDACYRKDGVSYDAGNFVWTDTFIPEPQLKWLSEDLAKTKKKTVVFCHQRLDLADINDGAVKNASSVRTILESSGKVIGVFMGHSHVNELNRINDIPYVCLHSMVDGAGLPNNAFSVLSVLKDGSMKLEGYGKHAKHPMVGGSQTHVLT
jgi:predicted phosphodiesterase